ncbi:hypothetical protein ACJ5NV_04225 [Loktanella agnita]|uniref:hypothetical protein n=1 Tax=Loktanella agnita TaxID=287097 RepID=UPI00398806BE
MLNLFAQSIFTATGITPYANTTAETRHLVNTCEMKYEIRKWSVYDRIYFLATRIGNIERFFQIEIQATPKDVDKIINSVMAVDPLTHGAYRRNAVVTVVGSAPQLPDEKRLKPVPLDTANGRDTHPSLLIVISVARRRQTLRLVLSAIRDVHHGTEPLIFIKRCWAINRNH